MMTTDWSHIHRLLCIRLDNMGDVLMSSPAMHALRTSAERRHITLLASPSGAAIAALFDCIDAIIPYDAPWVKNNADTPAAQDLALIDTLRAGNYDAAVIFTTYSQSALPAALMCRLAGIPRVLAHSRENPYRLIGDWVREGPALDGGRHEVRRQLDLVATVGAATTDERLRLTVPETATHAMLDYLRRHGINDTHGWLVVHPGATAASRRYPAERFGEALRLLAPEVPVLVTGSAQEYDLAQQVCDTAGMGINLAGALELTQFAALVQRAALLISNNSGPVHIAAATGTPVVDLYALTNPQHTPWQVPSRVLSHDVPCRNCYRSVCSEGHHRCLLGIAPADVARASAELGHLPHETAPARELIA